MKVPFLAKKDVIKGVTYNNTVVIRYILPKREVAKIFLVVVATELILHAPVRRAWLDEVENKIDRWVEKDKSDR